MDIQRIRGAGCNPELVVLAQRAVDDGAQRSGCPAGATPPMTCPVACLTKSGVARFNLYRQGRRHPGVSTRPAPLDMISSGSPAHSKSTSWQSPRPRSLGRWPRRLPYGCARPTVGSPLNARPFQVGSKSLIFRVHDRWRLLSGHWSFSTLTNSFRRRERWQDRGVTNQRTTLLLRPSEAQWDALPRMFPPAVLYRPASGVREGCCPGEFIQVAR